MPSKYHRFPYISFQRGNESLNPSEVKETSKEKKWSKGSKESAEGQGKAIQV